MQAMFTNTQVSTSRMIYTPSAFARSNLVHLQETGTLTALRPHVSSRSSLQSYLFLIVTDGEGTLTYQGKNHALQAGDCAFIDCRYPYSQCSGEQLWTLKWVHFYGSNLLLIYEKYRERGGQPVFSASDPEQYITLLDSIYETASSDSYIRDMELGEKLNSLLTLLMLETVRESGKTTAPNRSRKLDVGEVKAYLDQNYTEKITLESLEERFFINRHYLNRVFKEQYGTTVTNYVLMARITRAKGLLRFSDRTVEQIGYECGFEDPNYFTRIFKKVEGIPPGEYRSRW